MQPALAGTDMQIYQAPSLGRCRTVVLDGTWTDLLGAETFDLVQIRVPAGSRRVLAIATTDALAGAAATASHEAEAWVLDPGVHTFSTNRSPTDAQFFLCVDPTDAATDVAATARVKIRAAG